MSGVRHWWSIRPINAPNQRSPSGLFIVKEVLLQACILGQTFCVMVVSQKQLNMKKSSCLKHLFEKGNLLIL